MSFPMDDNDKTQDQSEAEPAPGQVAQVSVNSTKAMAGTSEASPPVDGVRIARED